MASDYLLQIDGIKGESQDKGHKGEIEVLSWSWGVSNSTSHAGGGGGGAGKVQISDFSFVKRLDSASPALFEACCSGQHISSASLTIARKAGGGQQEFYKIKLNDVLISSVSPGGTTGGNTVPLEQVSLNFTRVDISAADGRGQFISQVSCGGSRGDQFLGSHQNDHDDHK
jgi:type VI secretion system secreted protein Hcp